MVWYLSSGEYCDKNKDKPVASLEMYFTTNLIPGPMKLFHYLTGALLIAFSSSCSTYTPGISAEPDDRYYSLRDAKKEQREARKLSEFENSAFSDAGSGSAQPAQNDGYQRITDPTDYSTNDGSTVVNNYYNDPFEMDDYYDYMYSSRIRRFHRNNNMFGYYDPWFTNSYFYNPNPMMFGSSIYSSYGFFNPYVPWGFNNWNRPGFNIGWNSFSGFYMGWNSGWNNPWQMYNNPWRWNNWGYDPWMSPFSYNPWGYNPWGFNGGNAFNNGYMLGYSNALMYNNMMNNPMYYNSFDNNTYNYNNTVVNNVTNYGSNTPGAAGGSSFKQTGMTSLFSKEIGQSVSATHAGNTVKTESVKNPSGVKGQTGTTISPATASGTKGETTISQAQSQPVKGQTGAQIATKGEPTKSNQTIKPEVSSAVKPNTSVAGNLNQTVQPGKGTTTADGKNTVVNPALSGKDNLIQQGKPSVVSNYNSAPVKGSVAAPDNSPASARPQNVTTPVKDRVEPVTRPSNEVKGNVQSQTPRTYMPDYDYNTGVRSNSSVKGSNDIRNYSSAPNATVTQPVRGAENLQNKNEVTQPRQNTVTPNIQRYDTPKQTVPAQNSQQPGRVNNQPQIQQPSVNPNAQPGRNQSIETPRQSTPQQNYQRYEAPKQNPVQQNYQRYEAPRQSAPQQNYQRYEAPKQNAPSRSYERYEAPKQSSPNQRFQSPAQSAPSRGNQQYEAPRNNSRQNYQAPAPSRNSYQAPAPSRNSYQAPAPARNSYQAPSRSSSPRSSGGSISAPSRQSAPSSGSRGGSKSISSPRR